MTPRLPPPPRYPLSFHRSFSLFSFLLSFFPPFLISFFAWFFFVANVFSSIENRFNFISLALSRDSILWYRIAAMNFNRRSINRWLITDLFLSFSFSVSSFWRLSLLSLYVLFLFLFLGCEPRRHSHTYVLIHRHIPLLSCKTVS